MKGDSFVGNIFESSKSSINNLDILSRPPLISSFFVVLSITTTFLSLNRTLQPLSQKRPMESKALLSSGNRCTLRADSGRDMFFNNPVSVDFIIVPFATSKEIG